jgi:hypothetical protein
MYQPTKEWASGKDNVQVSALKNLKTLRKLMLNS